MKKNTPLECVPDDAIDVLGLALPWKLSRASQTCRWSWDPLQTGWMEVLYSDVSNLNWKAKWFIERLNDFGSRLKQAFWIRCPQVRQNPICMKRTKSKHLDGHDAQAGPGIVYIHITYIYMCDMYIYIYKRMIHTWKTRWTAFLFPRGWERVCSFWFS